MKIQLPNGNKKKRLYLAFHGFPASILPIPFSHIKIVIHSTSDKIDPVFIAFINNKQKNQYYFYNTRMEV